MEESLYSERYEGTESRRRDALHSHLSTCHITGVKPFNQRMLMDLISLQRLNAILH